MGCFGDKEKGEVEESQKWEYVTLSDFHAKGALAYLSYAWLWILALITCAVYGADTFTAVNLLAFDKWSGSVQPAIDIKYAKWIFGVCIIISWALCIFEWVRAVRVIRRGGVADSYMDSLAVSLQSMRSKGWRRFLVFAELTKSKKGMDYTALFVYFSFKGAIRIILAEAPRQCVNAFTLYSFMEADLIPTGDHAATNRSSFDQFWANVESLAESDREQAVVLFTMLFTLVIWVISALCLLIATILYLLFLWHWIPKKDGRLSIYCRRKIDRRLEKIVGQKVKQALEEQEKKEQRAAKKGGELPGRPIANRKPTLPQIGGKTPDMGDGPEFGLVDTAQTQNQRLPPSRSNTAPLPPQRQPTMPDLHGPGGRPQMPPTRNLTAPPSTLQRQATLPDMQMHGGRLDIPPPSRTGTAPPGSLQRHPTLPDLDAGRPRMPYRTDTEASALSNATYASDAPLLSNADEMGYSDHADYFPAQPQPTLDRQTSYSSNSRIPPLDRQASYANSRMQPALDRQASYATAPMPSLDRQASYATAPHPLDRQASYATAPPSFDRQASYTSRPMQSRSTTPMGQPQYDTRNDNWHPPRPDYTKEITTPISSIREDQFYGNGTPAVSMPQERHYTESPQLSQRQPPPPPAQSFQRPFPLARTGTGLSFSSRQESPIQEFEMQPQPQSRNVSTSSRRQPPQESLPSQLQPHSQTTVSANQDSGGEEKETYVAFKPSFAASGIRKPELKSGPQRSGTAPPEIDSLVRNGGGGGGGIQRPELNPGPQRSATAPPEHVVGPSYDDEDLLDEYGGGVQTQMQMQAHEPQAYGYPQRQGYGYGEQQIQTYGGQRSASAVPSTRPYGHANANGNGNGHEGHVYGNRW